MRTPFSGRRRSGFAKDPGARRARLVTQGLLSLLGALVVIIAAWKQFGVLWDDRLPLQAGARPSEAPAPLYDRAGVAGRVPSVAPAPTVADAGSGAKGERGPSVPPLSAARSPDWEAAATNTEKGHALPSATASLAHREPATARKNERAPEKLNPAIPPSAALELAAPKTAAPAKPGFAVQVGAYPDQAKADVVRRTLASWYGREVVMTLAQVRGKTYYRVRFPVETKLEAEELAARLLRETNLQTWVVASR